MTEDPAEMTAALDVAAASKPLICAATEANADAMFALAKAHELPDRRACRGPGGRLGADREGRGRRPQGPRDRLGSRLPPAARRCATGSSPAERRCNKKFAALGYPVITFPGDFSDGDDLLEVTYAAADVDKYGSIIVLTGAEPWRMLPLLVLRQNIYTDPQRPMQAEAKIYAINNPGPDAPFFITTNFSLTYFIVAGEIEGGKHARLPGRRRVRGPVGAHRVGRGQVRPRAHRQVRQGVRHRRA